MNRNSCDCNGLSRRRSSIVDCKWFGNLSFSRENKRIIGENRFLKSVKKLKITEIELHSTPQLFRISTERRGGARERHLHVGGGERGVHAEGGVRGGRPRKGRRPQGQRSRQVSLRR